MNILDMIYNEMQWNFKNCCDYLFYLCIVEIVSGHFMIFVTGYLYQSIIYCSYLYFIVD